MMPSLLKRSSQPLSGPIDSRSRRNDDHRDFNAIDPMLNWIQLTTFCAKAFACLMVLAVSGCQNSAFVEIKSIPAGLRDVAETRLTGQLRRAWGGDNFEFGQQDQLHYFFIAGVDCPEPGQPFYHESRDFLLAQTRDQTLQIDVLHYDAFKREFGHAWFVNENGEKINLAIALLEQGFAWYDGAEFENAAAYQMAHQQAQAAGRGLWQQTDPTPPWEFWQKSESKYRAD